MPGDQRQGLVWLDWETPGDGDAAMGGEAKRREMRPREASRWDRAAARKSNIILAQGSVHGLDKGSSRARLDA